MNNIFSLVPENSDREFFETLLSAGQVRIERIVSRGHTSSPHGWHDQEESEWVMVVRGAATLVFADGRRISLNSGDYLNIPAHDKHRVTWTDPEQPTVWLAIFYREPTQSAESRQAPDRNS